MMYAYKLPLLLFIATASVDVVSASSASRAHPSLLTHLQGKAACINCRDDISDIASTGVLNASALNLRKQITLSYWENKLTFFSFGNGWSTVNFFTFNDYNFLQPFMSELRGDFFTASSYVSSSISFNYLIFLLRC